MKKSFALFISLLLITSCLDRLNIPIPAENSENLQLVVDGVITNEPGPYTIRLSNVIPIDDSSPRGKPFSANKITLYDNAGNSEELSQIDIGVYQTSPGGMRGTIGREYHIRIETGFGKVFESIPDLMNPVGEVDSVYYEFEVSPVGPETVSGENNYGYRIFVDAHNIPTSDNYIRWKFVGTYVTETAPQYHYCEGSPCGGFYCPLKCSGYAYLDGVLRQGYAYNPVTQKTEYVIGLNCTCCRCWVTQSEDKPRLNDNQISANGKFNKVEVGFVPVNFYTFFERYRVQIVQMSLTPAAHDYWKSVRDQKDGTGSLFQPVTGRIPSNIFEVNKSVGVQGIFYASAVTKKSIYLDRNTNRVEVRVPRDCMRPIPRDGAVGENCLLAFPGSATSLQPPPDWN